MKVALVTCGLLDIILPLAKYISKSISVDLYVIVYGNEFKESVGSFDLRGVPEGLVDAETTKRILGESLYDYSKSNDQIQIRLFKYPSLKIFNKGNLNLHRRFANILNEQKYDIVHFNGYRGSLIILYALLKKSGKVWSIHDPIQHSGEAKWQTSLGYNLFRFLKVQFILHNKTQRPEFCEKYDVKAKNCHYLSFGPLEIFKLFENGSEVKAERYTVLFFGRISLYKGLEYLIKAAKQAKSKIPDLKIIIAGKPNYALDTTELENDKTFEFVNGFVPNESLVKLIKRATVIVCPYIDATQSGVIMTAYAFNKPVIATRVGGLPEVVEEGVTGRLVPPKDIDALSEAIVSILSDDFQLKKINQNIERITSEGKFSWKNIADDTIAVYKKAMADQ